MRSKTIIRLMSMLALGGIIGCGVNSCSDDFERPPMVIPEATIKANTTIAELKQTYWETDANYVETVGKTAAGENLVIRGKVISSDESGNIYRNLVIRDDSGEALTFAVQTSSSWKLYMSCRLGAEIVVNLTGLKVGGYNGLFQVGAEGTYNGKPSMTFMSESEFKEHMQADGIGNSESVEPIPATIAELEAAKATPEGLQKWQSQYIKITDVYFKDAGQPFALSTSNNTARNIVDKTGQEMIVWNSSHSNFASELLPQGYGNVSGILSYFGKNWQILLINTDGLSDFTGEPVTPPTPAGAIFSATFAESSDGFTIQDISKDPALDYVWSHDANYVCMKASAYKNNTSYPSESLLISPVIDLTKATAPVLNFEQALAKFPDIDFAKANCTVLAREEGATDFTPLEGVTYPATLSWTFVSSGNISLAKYAGKKMQFAFRYKSEKDKSGTWEVKNVTIR